MHNGGSWFDPIVGGDEELYTDDPDTMTFNLPAYDSPSYGGFEFSPAIIAIIFAIVILLLTVTIVYFLLYKLGIFKDKYGNKGPFLWTPSFMSDSSIRGMLDSQRSKPFSICDGGCTQGSAGCKCAEVQNTIL